jgi:hypothetical protein
MLSVLLGCRARHAHRHFPATTPCGPVKLAPAQRPHRIGRRRCYRGKRLRRMWRHHAMRRGPATKDGSVGRPLPRHQHARRPAAAAPARHLRVPGQVAPQCRRARPTARLPPHSSPLAQPPKEQFLYCSDSLRRPIIPNSKSDGHDGKAEPAVARR